MNDEEQLIQQLRQTAKNILEAAPAAREAISNALDRLDAPWYVRAWHQWKGHQGWGAGEELYIFAIVVGVGLLGLICYLSSK